MCLCLCLVIPCILKRWRKVIYLSPWFTTFSLKLLIENKHITSLQPFFIIIKKGEIIDKKEDGHLASIRSFDDDDNDLWTSTEDLMIYGKNVEDLKNA